MRPGSRLTTSSGFSLRASTTAFFPLTCASLCLPWNGASVSEPFSLVAFSVAYRGLQYTNVTVRAPATGYAGPLTIALDLP